MKTPITYLHPAVNEMLKALNLDTSKIREAHIHIVVNDIVLVDTVEYVQTDEMDELTEVIKKYKFVAEEIIEPEKDV